MTPARAKRFPVRPRWLLVSLLLHAVLIGGAWFFIAAWRTPELPPFLETFDPATVETTPDYPASTPQTLTAAAAQPQQLTPPSPPTAISSPAPLPSPQPSTLNPQPPTLNPQPSTPNPQPPTPNSQPPTHNSQPSTLNPQPSTLNIQPAILNLPSPAYPRTARLLGQEGDVGLDVMLAEDGSIERIEVRSSSGSAALDNAALDAARSAHYQPASKNNTPIPSTLPLTIQFRLNH